MIRKTALLYGCFFFLWFGMVRWSGLLRCAFGLSQRVCISPLLCIMSMGASTMSFLSGSQNPTLIDRAPGLMERGLSVWDTRNFFVFLGNRHESNIRQWAHNSGR